MSAWENDLRERYAVRARQGNCEDLQECLTKVTGTSLRNASRLGDEAVALERSPDRGNEIGRQ